MNILRRIRLQIALVGIVVAALVLANWRLAPEKAVFWLLPAAMMAVIYAVVEVTDRARPFSKWGADEAKFFSQCTMVAGLLLSGSLGISLAAELGFEGGALMDRLWGAGTGVLLILFGNETPKILSPLKANRCSPEELQRVKRFAGWSFVICGAGYVSASIALPIEYAIKVAAVICGSAVVLVLLRYLWMKLTLRN